MLSSSESLLSFVYASPEYAFKPRLPVPPDSTPPFGLGSEASLRNPVLEIMDAAFELTSRFPPGVIIMGRAARWEIAALPSSLSRGFGPSPDLTRIGVTMILDWDTRLAAALASGSEW
jgi:hypothetical protein